MRHDQAFDQGKPESEMGENLHKYLRSRTMLASTINISNSQAQINASKHGWLHQHFGSYDDYISPVRRWSVYGPENRLW